VKLIKVITIGNLRISISSTSSLHIHLTTLCAEIVTPKCWMRGSTSKMGVLWQAQHTTRT